MRLIIFLFACYIASSHAVVLDAPRLNLAEGMAYLEDPAGYLTLEEVRARQDWQTNHGSAGNFGFTPSAYWFRVELNAARSNYWSVVLHYPAHDFVDAYWLSASGDVLDHEHTGDLQPFMQRSVYHREFVFSRYLAAGESVQFYMRLKTEGTMQVPLEIMDKTAFAQYDNAQGFARGAYVGVMVVMVLYNIVIFLMTGMRMYRNYVGFVFSFLLMQMSYDGTGFMYLWPDWPGINTFAIPLTMSLSQLGFLYFAYHILAVPKLNIRARRFYQALNIIWGLLAMAVIFAPYHKVVAWLNMGSVLFTLCYFALSVVLAWRGQKFAAVFAVANFLFISGLMLGNLRSLGLLPGNFITLYGYMIGSLAETILFAIALALRILELQARRKQDEEAILREKERAQQQKIAALGELVTGVAHELNTPLGIVHTSTDFAREKHIQLSNLFDSGHLTKAQFRQHMQDSQSALGLACQNLDRMGKIVQTFKRSAVTQIGYRTTSTSLQELAYDIRQAAMHRNIQLELEAEDDIVLNTYSSALLFIITELLDNTLAHNPGLSEHRVKIKLKVRDSALQLHYADNGVISSTLDMGKLFDPFYTSQRGAGKHMGLGLYQVHNLVDQLFRGRVGIQRAEGLVFDFVFPGVV